MLRGVKNTPCAPIKTNGPRYLPGLSQKSVSPFLMQGHHLGDFSRRPIRLMATRNPARTPVEVGTLSHYLQGFCHIPGGCLGFLNHQEYGHVSGPAPIILIIFNVTTVITVVNNYKSSNKKSSPTTIDPTATSFITSKLALTSTLKPSQANVLEFWTVSGSDQSLWLTMLWSFIKATFSQHWPPILRHLPTAFREATGHIHPTWRNGQSYSTCAARDRFSLSSHHRFRVGCVCARCKKIEL